MATTEKEEAMLMSRAFVWELGFDFNAVVQATTLQGDIFFLQNGFMMVDADHGAGGVPATPVGLDVGDSVQFHAFNVTKNPEGTFTIYDGRISFRKAVTNQTIGSPFALSQLPFGEPEPASSDQVSVTFGGIQANQPQVPEPLPTFPMYAGPSDVIAVEEGRFLMTVILKVRQTVEDQDSVEKTFRVDPEMIIGGAG
jgi:hypothetical protein